MNKSKRFRPIKRIGSCVNCRRLSYGYYCEYKKQPAGCGLNKQRSCAGFVQRKESEVA